MLTLYHEVIDYILQQGHLILTSRSRTPFLTLHCNDCGPSVHHQSRSHTRLILRVTSSPPQSINRLTLSNVSLA